MIGSCVACERFEVTSAQVRDCCGEAGMYRLRGLCVLTSLGGSIGVVTPDDIMVALAAFVVGGVIPAT